MNVSIQLTKTAHSSNAGKSMTLRDVDLDTALAISTALRDLHNADLEALIVVEKLSASKRPARPAHKPQTQDGPAQAGIQRGDNGLTDSARHPAENPLKNAT